MTEHRTIRRNADDSLTSIDCPCGEDHGPSLREELDILRAGNRRQAERLNSLANVLGAALTLTEGASEADRIRARKLVSDVRLELDRAVHLLKLSAL